MYQFLFSYVLENFSVLLFIYFCRKFRDIFLLLEQTEELKGETCISLLKGGRIKEILWKRHFLSNF